MMFAYYSDGRIVGYYSLLKQNKEECELNNLCVLEEYRHKKIDESSNHCLSPAICRLDYNSINFFLVSLSNFSNAYRYATLGMTETFGACYCYGKKDGMLSDEYWNRGGKCEVAKMV